MRKVKFSKMSENSWTQLSSDAFSKLLDSHPSKRIAFIQTLPELEGKF